MTDSEDVRLDGFERLFSKTVAAKLEVNQLEQIEMVRGFFFLLDRLFKNATLYHFEHSSVEGLKKKLIDDMNHIFEKVSEFSVRIEPFEITMFDRQIFEHQNVENHYLFRLYQDGVRGLKLSRGLTSEELMTLCSILVTDFSRTEYFEDDLVTLIWAGDFPHISIEVCEVATEVNSLRERKEYSIVGLSKSIESMRDAQLATMRASRFSQLDLRQSMLRRGDLSQFRFPKLKLGDGERKKLDQLIASNSRERFEKFVEILFQLHLQFSSDQLGRGERIAVLFDRIADTMLLANDYGQLERLIWKLRAMHQEQDDDVEALSLHRSSIEYILEHWSQETFVRRIFDPVLSGHQETLESSIGVLANLNGSAVPAICRFGIEVADPRVRDRLWKLVSKHLKTNETQVARHLVGASIPVCRELIELLSTFGDPSQVGRALLNGLRNTETAVRIEVLSAAERVGIAHTQTLLLRALDDVDAMVRGKALHLLARHPDPVVASAVHTVIESPRFVQFSLDEKRRFCVAFALVGGDVSSWIKLLGSRSILESHENIELKHCALIALAIQLHAQCLDFAERYLTRKKQPLLVEAARWCEQHLRCPREERTRQLYGIFYSGKLVEQIGGGA